MKKLLAIILFVTSLNAFSQNTVTLPSPTTNLTPSFRYYGTLLDSLRQTWMQTPGGGWNRLYTATEANQRFALIGSLSGYVPTSRLLSTGFGLSGGGSLASNRTLIADTTVLKSKASALADYNILTAGLNSKQTATTNIGSKKLVWNNFNAFGDSFVYGAGVTAPDSAFVPRLATMVNKTVTNYGVGGNGVKEINYIFYNNSLASGISTPALTYIGINNIINSNSPSKYQNIRSGLSNLIVNQFMEAYVAASSGSITQGGTWSTLTTANTLVSKAVIDGYGSPLKTTVSGSTLTFGWTGDNLQVLTYAVDASHNFGSFKITVDGVDRLTYSPNGKGDDWYYSPAGTYDFRTPTAVGVFGLGAGSHTVVITSLSNNEINIDGVGRLLPASQCAPLMLGRIARANATGYAIAPAYGNDADVNATNVLINDLAYYYQQLGYPIAIARTDEFTNVNTDIAADGLHYNNLGNLNIAKAYFDNIDNKLSLNGGGVIVGDVDATTLHTTGVFANSTTDALALIGASTAPSGTSVMYIGGNNSGAGQFYRDIQLRSDSKVKFSNTMLSNVFEFNTATGAASFPGTGLFGGALTATDFIGAGTGLTGTGASFTSGNANAAPWSGITSKPTTISGYGITDFNSLGDARWLPIASPTLTGTLTGPQGLFTDGTQGLRVRSYTAGLGYGAIYAQSVTPSNANFTIASSGAISILSGTTSSALAVNGAVVLEATSAGVTAPTPAANDNSTKVATTAYVDGNKGVLPVHIESGSSYTALSTDLFIYVSGGSCTVTLPNTVVGQSYIVTNRGSGTVTVVMSGQPTVGIDGSPSATFGNGTSARFTFMGTNFYTRTN